MHDIVIVSTPCISIVYSQNKICKILHIGKVHPRPRVVFDYTSIKIFGHISLPSLGLGIIVGNCTPVKHYIIFATDEVHITWYHHVFCLSAESCVCILAFAKESATNVQRTGALASKSHIEAYLVCQ